ncbi:MAG: FAD-binding oxidoreductase [Pseudomonadales bacterium]|nr:FAD-binding oxidoreductase [Pseudomonadales bacterium]
MTHNGSYWFDSLAPDDLGLAAEPMPTQVDVAIIGGGYTGLWMAYYLSEYCPDLKVAILEAEVFGFGASGRNGGWCMGTSHDVEALLSQVSTRATGLRLARAMQATVDEIARVADHEQIDCHFEKGGNLMVATSPFQVTQLQDELKHLHQVGFTEADYRWLDAPESRARVGTASNFGAMFTPHCAAIHPARLARGLAHRLKARGVLCLESTKVTGYVSGRVETNRGELRADKILRATEGFTPTLKGQKRAVLPIYSMMVATEPLPGSVWDEIGLVHRETFGDPRRVVIYGQRTADDRLAFGGRGGYYFGSKVKPVIPGDDPGLDSVAQSLRDLFPVLVDYKMTHRWGGPLGVNRHWRPTVTFDPETGLGSAGGYVGEGVAASNLAARILVDLVRGEDSEILGLPWVDDLARNWELEPVRFLGARILQYAAERADASEAELGRPARFWDGLFHRFVD